jgi:hypothetical protein
MYGFDAFILAEAKTIHEQNEHYISTLFTLPVSTMLSKILLVLPVHDTDIQDNDCQIIRQSYLLLFDRVVSLALNQKQIKPL